jgi:hypothetical protein
MKHEDIVALAKQAGFNGNERIYDWCYTYHSSREFDDSYKQAFRLDITPEIIALVELAVRKEREECAKVCDARCIADGWEGCYADECAAAIRSRT